MHRIAIVIQTSREAKAVRHILEGRGVTDFGGISMDRLPITLSWPGLGGYPLGYLIRGRGDVYLEYGYEVLTAAQFIARYNELPCTTDL